MASLVRFGTLLLMFLIGINALAYPVVTGVEDPSFSGVEDLRAREWLTGIGRVDFDRYPQLRELYEGMIALTERLLVLGDGTRPVRLILADSMRPNAAYLHTVKGDRVIIVNLGLFKLVDNDDQLAFVLGHELEHGRSAINERTRTEAPSMIEQRDDNNLIHARLLNRVAENEVDVKSAFERVHRSGLNPYAGTDVLEKLREQNGMRLSLTHTTISSRIDTMEQALTGMTRLIGERIDHGVSTDVVSPPVKEFLDSEEFVSRRRQAVEEIISLAGHEERPRRFVESVKALESVPLDEFDQARRQIETEAEAIHASYESNKRRIDELLGEIAVKNETTNEILDYQNRYRTAFGNAVTGSVENIFGDGLETGTTEQLRILHDFLRLEYLAVDKWELGEKVSLSYAKALFSDLSEENMEEVDRVYRGLSIPAEREMFPKVFEGYINMMIDTLQSGDGRDQKLSLLRATTERIFGGIGMTYFNGRRHYLSTNREDFVGHMKRLYRAVIDHVDDEQVIAVFFGNPYETAEQKTSASNHSLKFNNFGGRYRLSVEAGLYAEIVDKRVAEEAEEMVFNRLYRRIEAAAPYGNLLELFVLTDGYFAERTGYLRSRDNNDGPPEDGIERAALAERLDRLVGLVKRHIPDRYESIEEQLPGFVGDVIKFRYFESSDIYDPGASEEASRAVRASLERLFSNLEKLERNGPLREFVADTLDFDGIFRAVEFSGADRDLYAREIARYADHFSNPSRQIMLTPGDLEGHEARRQSLAAAFGADRAVVDGLNAESVFRLLAIGPDSSVAEALFPYLSERRSRQLRSRLSSESYSDLLKKRAHYWFTRFGDTPPRDRVRQAFQHLLDEAGHWDGSDVDAVSSICLSAEPTIKVQDCFLGLAEVLEAADRASGNPSLSEGSKDMLRLTELLYSGKLASVSINAREKWELARVELEISSPSSDHDTLIDEFFAIRHTDPEIMEFFDDEALIGKLYFDSNKRKYALYQLNRKHDIDTIDRAFREGRIALPGVRQERRIVQEIRETVERQFPQNSHVKNGVLDRIEDALRTSLAETEGLAPGRIALDNWHETPELVAVDLPSIIGAYMGSPLDRREMLEYLVGIRERPPDFGESRRRRRSTDGGRFADMKRSLVSSSPAARAFMIQPLFDKQEGILSDAEATSDVDRLILGDFYENPLARRLFEAYLRAAPEAETRVIYAYIMASFVDAPPGQRGASLKSILEAMGPFGVKAGQFLHTSGLLPAEYSHDLKDFLSNALPPNRSRIMEDLKEALGPELPGIAAIGDRLGSGSVNYIQGVRAVLGGEEIEAVVRIRRDYVEGVVANENRIWMEVIRDLRTSGDAEEAAVADIVEEARRQSMSTLSEGGSELDLSVERDNFPLAQGTYTRRIRRGRLRGWEVAAARPNAELQALVSPEKQGRVSFYERVKHTPLEDIADKDLRGEVARIIVEAELKALFENGIYDPDGHPGNWLVDTAGRRIVRIDYAQLREVPQDGREAFKRIFSQLVRSVPDFSSEDTAARLATLLESDVGRDDLVKAIKTASRNVDFGALEGPQEKLFALRNAVQEAAGARVHLSDTLRSGLALLGKVSGFGEHLSGTSYARLLAKYVLPGYATSALAWGERTMDAAAGMRRLFGGGMARPAERIAPTPAAALPESLFEMVEGTASRVADAMEDSPTAADGDGRPDIHATAGYATGLDFADREPEGSNRIYPITRETYETLPEGTELYAIDGGKKYIKGINHIDVKMQNGRMAYGVSESDYNEGGGPKIADLLFGPSTLR